MKNPTTWIYFLFFGALWGVSEVIAGEALYRSDAAFVPVWLTAWALIVLSAARSFNSDFGSSTAIGAIACLFKLTTTTPFYCHLLGIFLLGLAFDIAVTLVIKRKGLFRALAAFIDIQSGSGYCCHCANFCALLHACEGKPSDHSSPRFLSWRVSRFLSA